MSNRCDTPRRGASHLLSGTCIPTGEPQYFITEEGRQSRRWGGYIINADIANKLYDQLTPKVIIPIHYGNEKCTFQLVDVEEFLKGKKNVVRPDSSEVEIARDNLPSETQIIVVKPAL